MSCDYETMRDAARTAFHDAGLTYDVLTPVTLRPRRIHRRHLAENPQHHRPGASG